MSKPDKPWTVATDLDHYLLENGAHAELCVVAAAGQSIMSAIDDAIKLRDRFPRQCTRLLFNDRIISINSDDTRDTVAARWDQMVYAEV